MRPLIAPRRPMPRAEPPLTRATAPRRDPAPSRVAYRLHRLWLTPLFRASLRRGLPVFAVILGFGLWFENEAHRTQIGDWIEGLRQSVAERPEFMVKLMAIDGASQRLADDIRAKVPVRLPVSSFDLDLGAMHEAILTLDAVQSADLHIRKGGVLEVRVAERQPVAIWRNSDGIRTLDATGHPVAPLLARLERPDLPLIVGDGADRAVPEALALLAVAKPIAPRIRGLIRVGERRWDVVVEPAIRLMLPEFDPVPALEQIIALDEASRLLDRDIAVVDLRNPARPTLRLGAAAIETHRQTNAILTGVPRP